MAILAVVGLGASMLPVPAASPQGETLNHRAGARPNILVIVTDDQRVGTMDVMPQTTHWFADRGRSHENAFVTTPLCCPSRATIFTGRYSHNHGVVTNRDGSNLNHGRTIQRYLQREGYLTGIAGKFLNRWRLRDDPPHFDRWAIMRAGYYDTRFNVNGRLRRIGRYSTRFVALQAVRTLRWFEKKRDAKPWLLFVTPFAPHGPFVPEERYEDAAVAPWAGNPGTAEVDRSDKPPSVQERSVSPETVDEIRTSQLRTLMSVDDLVHRVNRELRALGEYRRTLAFFLSDNGFLWGEHGLLGKGMAYTESVQVPMYSRWPGHIPAGSVSSDLVLNADIVPTIQQATGVPRQPRRRFDGRSLLSGFSRERVLLEKVGPWASLRTADVQYIEHYDTEAGTVTFREYYDLVTDPWQLENLLEDGNPANDPSQDELDALAAQLAADRACRGTRGPTACP